jgi:hypothetical protein
MAVGVADGGYKKHWIAVNFHMLPLSFSMTFLIWKVNLVITIDMLSILFNEDIHNNWNMNFFDNFGNTLSNITSC